MSKKLATEPSPPPITRVEFFIHDKHLGAVNRLLTKSRMVLADPPPKFQDVDNVAVANGKVVPKTSGSILELFAEMLRTEKPAEVTTDILRTFLSSIGRSPGSNSYLLQQARNAGLLRKVRGRIGYYTPNLSTPKKRKAK